MLLRDRQIDIVQRSAMKARPQQRFRAPIEEDEDQSAVSACCRHRTKQLAH